MPDNENKQYRKTYFMVIAICLCFLIGSFLFVFAMMRQNERANLQTLSDAAGQMRINLQKQIQADFQTLNGIAVCLGESGIPSDQELADMLQEINANNTFARMGLASPDGKADMLDIDGSVYAGMDLSGEVFFQQALEGKNVLSGTVPDSFSDSTVFYYTVPIRTGGRLIGILCAIHSSALFQSILNAPVLHGEGGSLIVDGEGKLVLGSDSFPGIPGQTVLKDLLGSFTKEEETTISELLQSEQGGQFTYQKERKRQVAVLEPLDVNGWFVITSLSQADVRQSFVKTLLGMTIIIVTASGIFLLLLYRQSRMMTKNRDSLFRLAYRDPLTGCRNFTRFSLDAEILLKEAEQKYAIWYCDFKKFKYFNDLFGYHTGDLILRRFAGLLEQEEGKKDLFCRVAADNFVGIRSYEKKEELKSWFCRLLQSLYTEESNTANRLHIELSMGCYCPEEEQEGTLSLNDMVNRANMAQKSVKHLPGSQCAFFTNEIRERILLESEMEAMGKHALEHGEFVLYFQPKIDIQKGNRLAGAEVLVRWEHPERGLISPGVFVPLFEKSGFIVPLDRYVFEQTCKWLRNYLEQGDAPINISVNVSRLGLFQDDFVEFYSLIKRKYRIPDQVLELEFTESVVLEDVALFQKIVRRLQANGFVCSLDDFGSGYSSLNMLKNLPIDVLKLDILFLARDAETRRERIVISHILAMARELRIKTIAEGVETMEQVKFLCGAGCDVVQGFVCSKPISRTSFERLLLSIRRERSKDLLDEREWSRTESGLLQEE